VYLLFLTAMALAAAPSGEYVTSISHSRCHEAVNVC